MNETKMSLDVAQTSRGPGRGADSGKGLILILPNQRSAPLPQIQEITTFFSGVIAKGAQVRTRPGQKFSLGGPEHKNFMMLHIILRAVHVSICSSFIFSHRDANPVHMGLFG